MATVRSKDGTSIAFDKQGSGPALILVDGALCSRTMGPSASLAALLKQHFTVYTYDRRGRGESGDTAPYSVKREVEDIDALVQDAGGSAFVWGISSGGALALEAANRLPGIKRLAIYEVPFIVDASRGPVADTWDQIGEAVSADKRGRALSLFRKSVGMPRFLVWVMRLTPPWRKLKTVAHTLPYDGALVRDNQRGKPLPLNHWTSITAPTLVMDGGKSPAWMRNANRELARVVPNARYKTIPGETHMIKAPAHVPTLVEFFSP